MEGYEKERKDLFKSHSALLPSDGLRPHCVSCQALGARTRDGAFTDQALYANQTVSLRLKELDQTVSVKPRPVTSLHP